MEEPNYPRSQQNKANEAEKETYESTPSEENELLNLVNVDSETFREKKGEMKV